MKLTEKPKSVEFPAIHYVYVERIGPFQRTAMPAWKTIRKHLKALGKVTAVESGLSLYKIEPKMIYRAGFIVGSKPKKLPAGVKYMKFSGGEYARFTLTGSYMNLPEACGRVFEIVEKKKIPLRRSWYLEHYVNDPDTTPENRLITEILIPTRD